ncbi:hypothetical protein [Methylomonas sp. AM2-LC]|uniref:hypothetical protein n=1 Tax=Methylomonas sp. AM2-LC TaxID=3153301 RepID=UPI003266B2DA
MTKLYQVIIGMTLSLVLNPVYAGTAVLGFEIGVSTLEQVNSSLSEKTTTQDGGINKYSNGPMLKTDGNSYEIDGLNEVLYIFDDQRKLMGVIMTMHKDRFDSIYSFIAKKYKVFSQERPFVGDKSAQFKAADSIIEINAPHLSFQMKVSYIRNDLMQKFNNQSKVDTETKKKSEAGNF